MRYLAIDLGAKRTGLAVGDDETGIAHPAELIEIANPEQRLRQISQAIAKHHPNALVVGLPLNMDGTEGAAARKARTFAAQLDERFGLPVHLVDERFSSLAAEERLSQTGMTRKAKKARRDTLAASAILTDFLQSQ